MGNARPSRETYPLAFLDPRSCPAPRQSDQLLQEHTSELNLSHGRVITVLVTPNTISPSTQKRTKSASSYLLYRRTSGSELEKIGMTDRRLLNIVVIVYKRPFIPPNTVESHALPRRPKFFQRDLAPEVCQADETTDETQGTNREDSPRYRL